MSLRSILVRCLLVLACLGSAWAQTTPMQPQWQLSHAPAGVSLETRAAAAGAAGSLHILGVQRPLAMGKDRTADRGWIGQVLPGGTWGRQTGFVMQPGDVAVQEIDAFAPLGNGEFAVAGQAGSGEFWLVAVNELGQARNIRSLGRSRIAFILPLANGDLVLGGRVEKDLYAARIRPDGGLAWEQRLDRGRDDLFLAGVLVDGRLVMLEHSGTREQFFMREANVGVTVLQPGDGVPGAPAFAIAGRAGALAAQPGHYGLVIDAGEGVKQRLLFLQLDAGFKQQAQAELLESSFGLERARLAAAGAQGWLLAGLDRSALYGLRLDAAGHTVARFNAGAERVFLHPDAVAGGEATYVVATELQKRDDGRGARSQVFVARFPWGAP
ncbi:exported hypothetical protein [Rubrivivax sp. A210]|uniref:hypothetical protein n=1 Tax=Rubrivivax sp. A210 TaxID=2772301 RepID=UPI0019192575|nr:hypothetical protein [Rubrivivax sp. A210]CAD5373578.1 exported hypothetical protein [Rubrivivax sp. A210]